MKIINKFVARRQNNDETITAIMTVTNAEKLHADKFLEALKKAVNTYTTYNEKGREMLKYSGGDFNFGDLVLAADDPSFINIAAKYRLFGFKITLIQNNQDDFDYDMNLTTSPSFSN